MSRWPRRARSLAIPLVAVLAMSTSPAGAMPAPTWAPQTSPVGHAPLPAVGPIVAVTPPAPSDWTWPLSPAPTVLRGFEPPAGPYGPGHRGVDLLGRVGQRVLAIGAGSVGFAGVVAGLGVVVIDHGRYTSTYEPVTSVVHAGEHVRRGQVVGLLQVVGSHCIPQACLHLGVRDAQGYVDPLDLLGPCRPTAIILKPIA